MEYHILQKTKNALQLQANSSIGSTSQDFFNHTLIKRHLIYKQD